MRSIVQTPCERVHLTLTVALLAACAANVALVCAWLYIAFYEWVPVSRKRAKRRAPAMTQSPFQ